MISPLWAAAVATLVLALSDHANRRWFGFMPDDPPRPGRKQHERPVPLAGMLLLPAVLPWLVSERAWFTLLATIVATTVGYGDDRGKEHGDGLPWTTKAAGLLLAAAIAATGVADPMSATGAWLEAALIVFVLTNATNFLDNTDGVAAALSAVSLCLLGQPWAVAAGAAALAFLPWNWPRPRLFLGDSGAYLLGVLAGAGVAVAVRSDARALMLTAVQLLDFAQVVLARLWLGHPPWVGDRRHLTHIAMHFLVPRQLVAPLFAALAAAIGLLALPR